MVANEYIIFYLCLLHESPNKKLPFLALVNTGPEHSLGAEAPALFFAITRNSYSFPSFNPLTVALFNGPVSIP